MGNVIRYDSTLVELILGDPQMNSGVQPPMPEKRPRAFIFWRIEQLLRRTLLHQPPLFEVQDFFRQSERLGGRMGGENQHRARALFNDPTYDAADIRKRGHGTLVRRVRRGGCLLPYRG